LNLEGKKIMSIGYALGLSALALVTGAVAGAAPLVTAYEDDGMVTVNGQRTLIIGSYAAALGDRPYAELAEAGFNLVNAGPGDPMNQAQAAGLMTWTAVGTLDPAKLEESKQALLDKVNAVKDHPALAFLETVDEPAWTWMKAEQRIPAEVFAQAYPIIKGADPNHLLYMNQAPTNLVSTLQKYNAGTDIVACDIYPVNPGGLKHSFALFADGYQGDLNNNYISQVGEYTDKMRRVTGPNRPLFMVMQGFAWEKLAELSEPLQAREEKVLYPTYAESRFMAFQSLIHGANGVVYWGHNYTPQPSQAWTDLKRVVREVADLAPVLAERRAKLDIEAEYHEMGNSVDDGVQTLAKLRDGKLYLFTCNADRYACKATLTGFGSWTTCKVLNEGDRTLPIENGGITDTWKRFDVHVYELSK
jgi:hypothetical protein